MQISQFYAFYDFHFSKKVEQYHVEPTISQMSAYRIPNSSPKS